MKLKTLFSIILKVLGILFIKNVLEALFQIFFIYPLVTYDLSKSYFSWTIFSYLLSVGLYIFAFYVLVFRTNYIISKLRLTDGIDQDDITMRIQSSVIIAIAILIIGGYIIIDSLPLLFRQLWAYFKIKNTGGYQNTDFGYTLMYGLKVVIGLLLIINQRRLVRFIESKVVIK